MILTSFAGNRYPEFTLPLDPVNTPIQRMSSGGVGPRILIMRLAAFGDVLMATPMLAALRNAYPNAHITWIIERHQRDTIIANPHIDEVLLWEGRYWKRLLRRGLAPLWLIAALRLRGELRRRKYDIFISLQPEEWPMLTRAICAPTRIGIFDTFQRFNRSKTTSNATKIYNHAFTSRDLPAHRTDQYLLALRALELNVIPSKKMHLGFTESDIFAYRTYLIGKGWKSGCDTVVVAPQTTWRTRCWPLERYAEVANRLIAEGYQIVLIGSEKERDAVAKTAEMLNRSPIICDGNLTFLETSAMIADASLLLSGDTGPMHVAAAVDTPYVAIFGPTSPTWYGPLAGSGICLSHAVPCGPCDQKDCPLPSATRMQCMTLVSVDDVYGAAKKLLGAPS